VAFQEKHKITLTTDNVTVQLPYLRRPWSKFTECDRAKDFLTKAGLSFETANKAQRHQ